MKKNAFLWSGAVIYLCLILLVFSLSHYGTIDIIEKSAYTRASADRLYTASYNLLFDLNLYLSREIGRVARGICERGGDPHDLQSSLDLNYWLKLVDSWLDEEGFSSTISIKELRLSPHENGEPRDLVQLNQLGLPGDYQYYEGAIDIDAVLFVSLGDAQVDVSCNMEFRIRSLCPIRIFRLYDLSHSFIIRVAECIEGWAEGRDAKDLAENISRGIVNCAEDFLGGLRSELFQGRIEYHVWTRRIGRSLFEVSITLDLVKLTDAGEFSFVLSDSQLQRVSYCLRDIGIDFKCRLKSPSDGSDTGECEGVICS